MFSCQMENVTSGGGKQDISQWNIRPVTGKRRRRASWCWGKSGHWMNKSLKIKYCSGFWGLSRHLNYVFELMLALTWSLPSLGNNAPLGLARISPFFYFFFLLILLVHRYKDWSGQTSHQALFLFVQNFPWWGEMPWEVRWGLREILPRSSLQDDTLGILTTEYQKYWKRPSYI